MRPWAPGAIVVDEIHAFAGDDRGWHLRAVLSRIERVAGRRVQRIGLSATVGNPRPLMAWIGDAQGVIVEAAGLGRSVEVRADHVGSLSGAAKVMAALHRGEKRLAFCDSRSEVEELAVALRGEGVETYVSHSSISRDERRQAEEAFAQGEDCVIVATSTLELGIDVGDLDRVIQIDAPATVASFLQRLGRSGRRAGSQASALFLTPPAKGYREAPCDRFAIVKNSPHRAIRRSRPVGPARFAVRAGQRETPFLQALL